jgi:hypothetical protein
MADAMWSVLGEASTFSCIQPSDRIRRPQRHRLGRAQFRRQCGLRRCRQHARSHPPTHLPRCGHTENGQSVFSQLHKDIVEARTTAAQESSGGLSIPAPPPSAFGISDAAQTSLVQNKLTPHPNSTFVSPIKLANKVGNGLPTSCIVCADPIYRPLEASRNWVNAAGWKVVEIKSGHHAI